MIARFSSVISLKDFKKYTTRDTISFLGVAPGVSYSGGTLDWGLCRGVLPSVRRWAGG
jgi:hypothetical protein